MKKKKWILIVLAAVVAAVLLIPMRLRYKDGGSVCYRAIVYDVTRWHQMDDSEPDGYKDGLRVRILGVTVYERSYDDDGEYLQEEATDDNTEAVEIKPSGQTTDMAAETDDGKLTDDQALEAIRNYCYIGNPDLAGIVEAGVYPVYWNVEAGDEDQVVVMYRSYTGALVRYYIDRATGETYVTEFVPGITPEEEKTEESLNVWEYVVQE